MFSRASIAPAMPALAGGAVPRLGMTTKRVRMSSTETEPIKTRFHPRQLNARRVTLGLGLPPLLRAMRPHQWTKNAIVGAALIFDRRLFQLDPLVHGLAAILCFCAVS